MRSIVQCAEGNVDEGALQALAVRAAGRDEQAFGELGRAVEPMVRSDVEQKIRGPAVVPSLTDIVLDAPATTRRSRRPIPAAMKSWLEGIGPKE